MMNVLVRLPLLRRNSCHLRRARSDVECGMPLPISTLFVRAAKAAHYAVVGGYSRIRLSMASSEVDYLLVSYPKSGRTWFRYILSCYFAESLGFSAMPDLPGMFRILPNLDWDPARGLPAYGTGPAAAATFPLIAVTHHAPRTGWLTSMPVIFMLRDPRDVLVSRYYHATRHKHQYSGDIAAFIRDGEQGLPAWVKHTNDWAAALVNRPHAIVSYERLRASPLDETRRVLAFLGEAVDPERLERAVAAAKIDRMRELEVQTGIPGHHYDRSDPQALRVRRGIVGGYREELSQADLDWIDHYNSQHLLVAARELVGHLPSEIRRDSYIYEGEVAS